MTCGIYTQARLRSIERLLDLAGDPMVEYEMNDFMHNLRLALMRLVRTRLSDLSDSEAAEAIGNLADSLRTQRGGLIYEFRSSNPRIQMVTDALGSVLELHGKGEKELRKVGFEDAERCVRQLKRQVDAALKREVSFLALCDAAAGVDFIVAGGKPEGAPGRLIS